MQIRQNYNFLICFVFQATAPVVSSVPGTASGSSPSLNPVLGNVPPEHQLLPDLDIFNLSGAAANAATSSGNVTPQNAAAKKKEETEEELEDNLPLFYQ